MNAPSDIEEALGARLKADAAVAALVGVRVYAVVAPGDVAKPFVTFQEISALDAGQHLRGPSNLMRSRYQVDAWADRRGVAKSLGAAIRACLDGYRGDTAAADTTIVRSILFEDRRDLYEAPELLHRVSIDFLVWHSE